MVKFTAICAIQFPSPSSRSDTDKALFDTLTLFTGLLPPNKKAIQECLHFHGPALTSGNGSTPAMNQMAIEANHELNLAQNDDNFFTAYEEICRTVHFVIEESLASKAKKLLELGTLVKVKLRGKYWLVSLATLTALDPALQEVYGVWNRFSNLGNSVPIAQEARQICATVVLRAIVESKGMPNFLEKLDNSIRNSSDHSVALANSAWTSLQQHLRYTEITDHRIITHVIEKLMEVALMIEIKRINLTDNNDFISLALQLSQKIRNAGPRELVLYGKLFELDIFNGNRDLKEQLHNLLQDAADRYFNQNGLERELKGILHTVTFDEASKDVGELCVSMLTLIELCLNHNINGEQNAMHVMVRSLIKMGPYLNEPSLLINGDVGEGFGEFWKMAMQYHSQVDKGAAALYCGNLFKKTYREQDISRYLGCKPLVPYLYQIDNQPVTTILRAVLETLSLGLAHCHYNNHCDGLLKYVFFSIKLKFFGEFVGILENLGETHFELLSMYTGLKATYQNMVALALMLLEN